MLDDKVHDAIISETTLKLGRIHKMVLKSAHLMDGKRWAGGVSGHECTEFGNEVGSDEIHWWIFKKEINVDELSTKTKQVLLDVQRLKDASAKLNYREPESYEDILNTLRAFAEKNRTEVDRLEGYVTWLEERDPMAPRILFTYRVWGSTRMADREIDIEHEKVGRSGRDLLPALTEVVLGVRERRDLVYYDVYNEIGFEIYESMDPEQLSLGVEIVVPSARVVRRTANEVYQKCATYFEQTRDSLRNILLDIDKFKKQSALFESEKFWREFIVKASQAKTSEPQLWDFKETLTMWHVKKDPEKGKAKVTFAEDVASFANASGGVLVVGVNDSRQIVGIGDGRELETRLKFAREVLKEFIKYDRDLTSFKQLVIDGKICLVIVISQAYLQVGVWDGHEHYSYPIRLETGIKRVGIHDLPHKHYFKHDSRDFLEKIEQFVRDN